MDFQSFELFASLPIETIEKIKSCAKSSYFAADDFLVVENEKGSSFFLIEEGEVEILKDQIPIGMLRKGDVLGETSLINRARTASAKAKGAVTAIEISVPPLKKELTPAQFAVLKNAILEKEIDKISNVNKIAALSIQQNFEDLKAKEHIGQFIVYLLAFIFIYVFAIQSVIAFKLNIVSSSIISIPILLILGIAMYLMMKRSGYPLETYGFTLKGWKGALIESALFTIPIFIFLIILKWVLIHTVHQFSHLTLFHISPSLMPGEHVSHLEGAILVMVYALFVPVQEMVFRGAIQSSLEKFLSKKNKISFAIFVSNIPYALIHFHLSLILVVLVYFFGSFWGWMYSRQKTLVGPVFSHFIVGLFAFFILGIQDILVI